MSVPMREARTHFRGSREGLGEPLQTLFGVGTLAGLTDGQLLERFVGGGVGRRRRRRSRPWWSDTVRWCGRLPAGTRRPARRRGRLPGDVPGPGAAGRIDPAGGAVASWLYSAARRVAIRPADRPARIASRGVGSAPPRPVTDDGLRRRRGTSPELTKRSTGFPSDTGPPWCSATFRATP